MRRGEGQGLTFIHWATAVLHNGLGRYEEALAAAQQAAEDPLEVRRALGAAWGLVELIEAAARSGKPELAVDALEPAFADDRGQLAPTGRSASRPARGRC